VEHLLRSSFPSVPTLIMTRGMTKEIIVKIFVNIGVVHQTTLSHFTVAISVSWWIHCKMVRLRKTRILLIGYVKYNYF